MIEILIIAGVAMGVIAGMFVFVVGGIVFMVAAANTARVILNWLGIRL